MALLVVDTGQNWIVDLIHDSTDAGTRASGAWEWGAWGTGGATAEDIGDTALANESAEARVEAVTSQPSADTIRSVFTITSLSTQAIDEVGLFNQATPPGILLMRGTFPVLNLEADDRIEFTLDNRVKADTEA